jgi:ATP-binding cassette subfamily C protein
MLVVISFVVVLGFAAPLVTLFAAAALVLFLLLPVTATTRRFRRWGTEQGRLEAEMLQELQQSLGALKEVKMAGAEKFFLRRFGAIRGAFSRIEQRRAVLTDGLRLAVETTFVVTILLVVGLMTLRGAQPQSAVSLLGLYAYAGFRLVPSANRITRNINSIRGGRPYLDDLQRDLLALDRDARRRPEETPGSLRFANDITLEGVSYAYGSRVLNALDNVTLQIRRGESVGILGPTGAGKSTLVAVLLGLLEPTAGRVLVDGRDIRDALQQWQGLIGYVPQESFLLDDTLRANIAFGVGDGRVDEEALRRATRLAQLDEVVAGLPDGLETPIGERGAHLSGGQRQRVAIARALYRDPEVLVFDEATAALDLQTEREVTRAVGALHGDKTIIVIAHRLSTVRVCDGLIAVKEGRIAGTGSWEELLVRDVEFRTTVTMAG